MRSRLRQERRVSINELLGMARENTEQRQLEDMLEQQTLLDTIGLATDPLATEALGTFDRLPEEERARFLQNVFRRLVVQTLHTAGDLDESHVTALPNATLEGYGGGIATIAAHGDLQKAVIEESLPDGPRSSMP